MDTEKLVEDFPWADEDEGSNGPQPEASTAKAIFKCVEKVAEYTLKNLESKHLDFDAEDDTRLRFYLSIPPDLHPLLQDRINSDWTHESRVEVFELIQAAFDRIWNDLGRKKDLNQKISEIYEEPYRYQGIAFWDEPYSGGELTEDQVYFGVEILCVRL